MKQSVIGRLRQRSHGKNFGKSPVSPILQRSSLKHIEPFKWNNYKFRASVASYMYNQKTKVCALQISVSTFFRRTKCINITSATNLMLHVNWRSNCTKNQSIFGSIKVRRISQNRIFCDCPIKFAIAPLRETNCNNITFHELNVAGESAEQLYDETVIF